MSREDHHSRVEGAAAAGLRQVGICRSLALGVAGA